MKVPENQPCHPGSESCRGRILDAARRGLPLETDAALCVLSWPVPDLDRLLAETRALRRRNFGSWVDVCAIVNARSGRCGEDCRFCAQSVHYKGSAQVHPLLDPETIRTRREAFPAGLRGCFGVVTSGGSLPSDDQERIAALIAASPGGRVSWCASLGMLDETALRRLRAAGLVRYHHNLETAESHFPDVCSTHTYADRVATVRAAQRAGLEVCCGALFGLGESPAQRVELIRDLRALGVDSMPLNFLVPIPGTPLAESPPTFTEADVLRIVAMARLMCPQTPIRLCGGRDRYLSESGMRRALDAGATGIMIGDYLTLRGRGVRDDLAMIHAAGYRVRNASDGDAPRPDTGNES